MLRSWAAAGLSPLAAAFGLCACRGGVRGRLPSPLTCARHASDLSFSQHWQQRVSRHLTQADVVQANSRRRNGHDGGRRPRSAPNDSRRQGPSFSERSGQAGLRLPYSEHRPHEARRDDRKQSSRRHERPAPESSNTHRRSRSAEAEPDGRRRERRTFGADERRSDSRRTLRSESSSTSQRDDPEQQRNADRRSCAHPSRQRRTEAPKRRASFVDTKDVQPAYHDLTSSVSGLGRSRYRYAEANGRLPPGLPQQERLSKVLSRCGVSARRKAEDLIREGKVRVNGVIVAEVGRKIDPFKDVVRVKDAQVSLIEEPTWVILNKPRHVLSTVTDDRGRLTATDMIAKSGELPSNAKKLVPVGRLDRDTTGLLLLTDDYAWVHRLAHPSFEHWKEYLVTVDGQISDEAVEMLRRGVLLPGEEHMRPTAPAEVFVVEKSAKLTKGATRGTSLLMRIREGRNRQIRRMLFAVDHSVLSLHRNRFAGVNLGTLKPGQWRALTPDEISRLKSIVGSEKAVQTTGRERRRSAMSSGQSAETDSAEPGEREAISGSDDDDEPFAFGNEELSDEAESTRSTL